MKTTKIRLHSLLKTEAANAEPELIQIRRHLHKYPELSFNEYKTSEYIQHILKSWQIDFSAGWAETGIVAVLNPHSDGKTIAIRADMDALPVDEQSGLKFKSSKKGVMHACGHDIHMTCLLGAARLMQSFSQYFNARIILLFQPGEEKLPGGAAKIIQQGFFTQYKPDFIIGQHIAPEMQAGMLGFRSGRYMASSDEIYIRINSKGGHAAMPHLSPDPVLAASQIVVALQQIASRLAPPSAPTILSFGNVNSRNGATNVFPTHISLEGTFRTLDETWRKKAHNKIRQIVNGIAQSSGITAEVEIVHGYPMVENHLALTQVAINAAKEFAGDKNVQLLDMRMTSEDFGYYSQTVPSLFYRTGVGFAGKTAYSLHSPGFVANENAIAFSSAFLAFLVYSVINAHI